MLLMSCQWKADLFVNQVASITLQRRSVLPLPHAGSSRALQPKAHPSFATLRLRSLQVAAFSSPLARVLRLDKEAGTPESSPFTRSPHILLQALT